MAFCEAIMKYWTSDLPEETEINGLGVFEFIVRYCSVMI